MAHCTRNSTQDPAPARNAHTQGNHRFSQALAPLPAGIAATMLYWAELHTGTK